MQDSNNNPQTTSLPQMPQPNNGNPQIPSASQAPQTPPPPMATNSNPPAPPPVPPKTAKNILLVEDDPIIIRMYSTKLTNSGYTVKEALNGQEAFDALNTFHPDIILLDLMLPQLDGFGFLQKAKPIIGNIPVIVLTNLSQDSDKARAKEFGVTDFLVKADITPQIVVDTIQKYT